MPRHHNRIPAIALSAALVGGLALYAYEQSHHDTGGPKAESTQAPPVPELPNVHCHMRGRLPDPACTPGAINPDVTQKNIHQTICVTGFTKTVRPNVSYTNRLKKEQMQAYGFTDSVKDHEEDHLISLELGGSPDDPRNLWPEPDSSPNDKDKVENFLHAAVCAGHISLHAAQVRIATDWTTAEAGLN